MESLAPPLLESNPLGIHSSIENNNMDIAICRVCLATERLMVNIFEIPSGSSTSIADMISQCTGIYISQRQTYPKTICRPCMLAAQNAYEFKQTFERSHQYFSQVKEKVCFLPDGDVGTDKVMGFEIRFLEEEEYKKELFTDQARIQPTEEDPNVEDQLPVSDISEVNPSEGADDRDDNATNRPFKCSQCQITFIFKQQLIKHIQIHTGERPFQCEYCPKSFTKRQILKVHLNTHTGERPFKCFHCPKSFAQKATRLVHMRIHTGERPFKCSQCMKTFLQPAHLKKHQLKHTGERAYKCSLCPQSFADRFSWKRHNKVHNKGATNK